MPRGDRYEDLIQKRKSRYITPTKGNVIPVRHTSILGPITRLFTEKLGIEFHVIRVDPQWEETRVHPRLSIHWELDGVTPDKEEVRLAIGEARSFLHSPWEPIYILTFPSSGIVIEAGWISEFWQSSTSRGLDLLEDQELRGLSEEDWK